MTILLWFVLVFVMTWIYCAAKGADPVASTLISVISAIAVGSITALIAIPLLNWIF